MPRFEIEVDDKGDFVGDLMLEGRGAGAHPTASAVLSDVVDIARANFAFGYGLSVTPMPISSHCNKANMSCLTL